MNFRAILENCISLHKGCTIISIGNDVLIAPNAYVNSDVSSHSIVIGNPGVIIHKDHATRYANEDNYYELFNESLNS